VRNMRLNFIFFAVILTISNLFASNGSIELANPDFENVNAGVISGWGSGGTALNPINFVGVMSAGDSANGDHYGRLHVQNVDDSAAEYVWVTSSVVDFEKGSGSLKINSKIRSNMKDVYMSIHLYDASMNHVGFTAGKSFSPSVWRWNDYRKSVDEFNVDLSAHPEAVKAIIGITATINNNEKPDNYLDIDAVSISRIVHAEWPDMTCYPVGDDLKFKGVCGEYGGETYLFDLAFWTNPENPEGFYWKAENLEAAGSTMSECVKADENFRIDEICGHYQGNQYAFAMDFFANTNDPAGIYWVMDQNSLKSLDVTDENIVLPESRRTANGMTWIEDDIRVLKVWGTHYERGFAHGFLLQREIFDMWGGYVFPTLTKGDAKIYNRVHQYMQTKYDFREEYINEAKGVIDGIYAFNPTLPRHIEQIGRELDAFDVLMMANIEGIAVAVFHNLPQNQMNKFIYSDSIQEESPESLTENYNIPGCSSASVWGENSAEAVDIPGETALARLVDWGAQAAILRNHLVMISIPSEEYEQTWTSLTWSGCIWGLSGMNESGIAAVEQTGNSIAQTPLQGEVHETPTPMMMREGLEMRDFNGDTTDDVNDVVDALKAGHHTGSWIVHIAGPSQPSKIVEIGYPDFFFVRSSDDNTSELNRTHDTYGYPLDYIGDMLLSTNYHFREQPGFEYVKDQDKRYERMIGNFRDNTTISSADDFFYRFRTATGFPSDTEAWKNVEDINKVGTINSMLFLPNQKKFKLQVAEETTPAHLNKIVDFSFEELVGRK